MKPFYGNKLVSQVISRSRLNRLTIKNKKHIIYLTQDDYINLINICLGFYSPLTGFCDYKDFYSITRKNKLSNSIDWTIPILLNSSFKKKGYVKLKYKSKIVGAIDVKSTFKINKKLFNKKVFGTNSNSHPGAAKIKKRKNYFISGKTYLLTNALPTSSHFYSPKKVRSIFKKKKIQYTAFSTRNICHSGHEFIHSYILRKVKILHVVVIQSSANKYDPRVIFKTYEIIRKKKGLKNKIKIISIFMPTFFAGPKEAFLQAIMMQNLGFSNFVIGRDHAGVKNFYGKYESQKIFENLKDLSLNIFKTKEPRICYNCKRINFAKKINRCMYCFSKTKLTGIDGMFVKKKIAQSNFLKLEGMLNPYLISYFKRKKRFLK